MIDDEQRLRFHESIADIAESLPYAVSMGIGLSYPVLKTVVTAPTWTYNYHYRQVNIALDQAALFIAGEIRRAGFTALPIPASQILDWDHLRAHLSHREIAGLAGLGWMGRNNLLVTPQFGSQVRLVTVLTDMGLPGRSGSHEGGDCGTCRACVKMCPVGAIDDDPAKFDLDSCAAQLRRFSKSEKINTLICGLCIKVCRGQKDI
jgi:epoxyqueuosine reductase QueG